MAVEVHSTGVLIRAATADEVTAVERASHYGGEFELDPPRSYRFSAPSTRPGPDEIYVVSVAFVDFTDDDGTRRRWTDAEHHGTRLTTTYDVTAELLALARETEEEGFPGLLGDLRIHDIYVKRWQFYSAPRRYDLGPELRGRLAPPR